MKYNKLVILAVLGIIVSFVNCSKIETGIPSLKDHFKDDFLVGAAIEDYQLDSEAHQELLKKHFNSITAENDMKYEATQPREGVFTFKKADKIVNFAMKNNMHVRGHTLLWDQQTPNWFFLEEQPDGTKETVSAEVLKKRIKTHIQTIVKRYKGKVYAWDVVNEAIEPDKPDGFRDSFYYAVLGEEYIELAFRYAHEADPNAKLFYNDFNCYEPQKRIRIVNMIKKLQAKGVPIHGIGMQMHVSILSPEIDDFERALKAFVDLGLDIHITEFDMSVYRNTRQKYDKLDPEVLNQQGHRVKEFFNVIKKYKKHISNVTFWGMGDDHTWLTSWPVQRKNWPLIFDKELKAKPFYWGIVDPNKLEPLKEKPKVAVNSTNDNPEVIYNGTAKIDGTKDQGYELCKVMPVEKFIQGIDNENSKTSGATGKAWAMWDAKNLYVYVEVKDSKLSVKSGVPYLEDSVEVFLDERNDKTDYYDDDDGQYRINYKNRQTFGNTEKKKGYKSATKVIPGGYAVEVKIPFKMIKAKEGMKMGFDLQVNDDQGTGKRDSITKWNDPTNNSWQTTKRFGVVELKKN